MSRNYSAAVTNSGCNLDGQVFSKSSRMAGTGATSVPDRNQWASDPTRSVPQPSAAHAATCYEAAVGCALGSALPVKCISGSAAHRRASPGLVLCWPQRAVTATQGIVGDRA
jgi:hypothetical protein